MTTKGLIEGGRGQEGVTLVEILVAAVILIVIASGIFQVFITGRSLVGVEGHRAVALQVAQEVLDELKLEPGYTSFTDTSQGAVFTQGNHADYLTSIPGLPAGATARYIVTDVVDGGTVIAKKVTVVVDWTEPQ
jgi:type II secretory pathway pseudopilin PulG